MRVVVVGLGTAGAAVAAQCARRGLQVVGLERTGFDRSGARWVNGVPRWAYQEAGLPDPVAPELLAPEGGFHLIAGRGTERMATGSVLEVDMGPLTERLLGLAREHGAELRSGVKVRAVDGTTVHLEDGTLEGDVVVDCSGHNGLRLMGQPDIDREDLCAAAQQIRHVTDMDAAKAWFASQGVPVGQICCFTGVAGGYSILNVRLHGDHVGLLTGTLPALGNPSGLQVLESFVDEQPWIGERVSGGHRAIPLRRGLEVVGQGPYALLGDSASQVFAAHGSGIAMQLVGARLLAESLATGGGTWGYNVHFQRTLGGRLAGADVFRRFSARLPLEDLEGMLRNGIMSPELSADTMTQRPMNPPPLALARAAAGLAKMPKLAARLAPVLVTMRRVEAHYKRYPADPAGLDAWLGKLERITGLPTWRPAA